MKKPTLLIAILTVTSSLSMLPFRTLAAPGGDHGHDHGHSHAEKTKVKIPETRDDLWKAIQAEHAALLQAVETKADGAAHEAEGKLQAYLTAFPEKISDLEESARKRIEGQTRNLARAYGAVHHAADDKAWDKAVSEMKKADGGMQLLKAQLR